MLNAVKILLRILSVHVLIGLVVITGLFFTSGCSDRSTIEFADRELVPLRMSLNELRNSAEVTGPRDIISPVKVQFHNQLLLVMDKFMGVHVIDNTDSTAPVKLNFLTIPGITHFEVRADHLFATSGPDLVVFSLEQPAAFRLVSRMEGQFILDSETLDNDGVIVGFETREFINRISETHGLFGSGLIIDETTPASFRISNAKLMSGDIARFSIVNEHMYVISDFFIRVLDISDPENVQFVSSSQDQFFFFQNQEVLSGAGTLVTASSNGNAIWDISKDATNPELVTTSFEFFDCSRLDMVGNTVVSGTMDGGFCSQGQFFLVHHELDPDHGLIRLSTNQLSNFCTVIKILPEDVIVGLGENGVSIFEFNESIEQEWFTHSMHVMAADANDRLFVFAGEEGVTQFVREDDNLTPISTIR